MSKPTGVSSLVGLTLLLLITGCASALHPVEDLPRLQASSSANETLDALLGRARAAYSERSLESVSTAARLGLDVAALDPDQLDGLLITTWARIWLADHQVDADLRRAEAVHAVKAAQLCRERDPSSAECRYVLALAVGVQARERRSTGLEGVKVMVELLTHLVEQAPEMDHAGPHRVLALVYLRAPGWPTGPGDPDAGLEHAQQAIELAPSYPPNQICLAEAFESAGEIEASQQAYRDAAVAAQTWLDRGELDAAEWLRQATLGTPPG